MSHPTNNAVRRHIYHIHDWDFLVNAIWEEAGDELHSNDIYAAKIEYGGRIISGLAVACLSVAEYTAAANWSPPGTLDLRFESAVKLGDAHMLETRTTESGANIAANIGTRRALDITLDLARTTPNERSELFKTTKGRTFTAGDREVFDWRVSTSIPGLSLAPSRIVPWPQVAVY